MPYTLFIDDERDPPADGKQWIIVRSSDDAIATISDRGWPEHISFDHDLGGQDTAMIFVRWIIDKCLDEGIGLPFTWYVHSQNPIGRQAIETSLEGFACHVAREQHCQD